MEILGTYDKLDTSHENLSENTKDSEPKISEPEKKNMEKIQENEKMRLNKVHEAILNSNISDKTS